MHVYAEILHLFQMLSPCQLYALLRGTFQAQVNKIKVR
jgi:hypothetical protein